MFPNLCAFEKLYKEELLSNNNHPHHVTPSARISLSLSRHPSLLSIASGKSSGLHPYRY